MGKKKKLPDKNTKLLSKHQREPADKLTNQEEQTREPCDGYTSGQLWGCLCVYGVFVLGVYVYTMYPTIVGGDSGELMAAAQELGVAHPPGYPLFTMLCWLAIQVIPVDDVAWKCNLLNAVFSALAGVMFAAAVYKYTGSVGCAIGGSSAWCFCKLTWTWAASAEVFGLNNLFTAALVYLMAGFQEAQGKDKSRAACLGAFVCGLSLTNQHTIVLYVGFIALWVLLELANHKLLCIQQLACVGACFTCGLLPYVYMPLSSYLSHAQWTWGDQRTLQGFITHFLRTEYGTFDLAKDTVDESSILSKLSSYGWHAASEFSVPSLLFFLLGVKETMNRAMHQRNRSLLTILAMFTFYLLFFCWRANLSMANPLLLGVIQRFWLQADCVYVLLAAVGASYLHRVVCQRFSPVGTPKVLLALSLVVCACQMQRNFTECNQRHNRVCEEFGLQILENVPPNTLLLTRGDLSSNIFRYLYLSRNHRPDVTVFDQEVMTYAWSLPMMAGAYPTIIFPGDRMDTRTGYIAGTSTKVFNSRTFFDVNIERSPVITCIGVQDHDDSWQSGYDLFPFGPCNWVYKKGTAPDIDTLTKMAANITDGWKYPYQGFDETTWERVATDEMWNAKINIGYHLYMLASTEENSTARSSYLIKSFEIYKRALDAASPEGIPSYWHKNYALVCEKMLQVDHSYSYIQLARDAVHHFQTYLETTPGDTDAPAIAMLIQNIKTQIQNFERGGK